MNEFRGKFSITICPLLSHGTLDGYECDAITNATFGKEDRLLLNVGKGASTSLNELLKLIKTVFPEGKVIVSYKASREFDASHVSLDVSKAKEILGWSPEISLSQGIDRILKAAS